MYRIRKLYKVLQAGGKYKMDGCVYRATHANSQYTLYVDEKQQNSAENVPDLFKDSYKDEYETLYTSIVSLYDSIHIVY